MSDYITKDVDGQGRLALNELIGEVTVAQLLGVSVAAVDVLDETRRLTHWGKDSFSGQRQWRLDDVHAFMQREGKEINLDVTRTPKTKVRVGNKTPSEGRWRTALQLAAEFDRDVSTIRFWAKKHGVQTRLKKGVVQFEADRMQIIAATAKRSPRGTDAKAKIRPPKGYLSLTRLARKSHIRDTRLKELVKGADIKTRRQGAFTFYNIEQVERLILDSKVKAKTQERSRQVVREAMKDKSPFWAERLTGLAGAISKVTEDYHIIPKGPTGLHAFLAAVKHLQSGLPQGVTVTITANTLDVASG